jgi:hypothetical protein
MAAVAAGPSAGPGYWLVGGDGSVYPFGAAGDLGSLRGTPLARPVTGMAPTPTGAGYWMVGSDGGIFSFGDAGFHGSTGAIKLNQPIVGMASTPSGKGYWFVAADGGIFAFGDARFYGSTGAMKLNKPIVGMAPTPSGKGYWFVASDGGIFAFGDAAFYGSTGAMKLNKPIVGMAPTRTGKGYWFVASDGGIFAFGDAAFYGSTGAMTLAKPIVGMAASPTGKGYWFVASDGGIFNFGDAAFLGSAGGKSLPAGVVVMAGINPGSTPTTTPTTAITGPTGTAPTVTTTTTTTGPAPSGQAFQMGLIGDSGYMPDQLPVFDQVVAHMNTFPLAFVAHDGDFKDPRSSCTDAKFETARTAFNKSKAPFVYTPGDNEWMDCNGDLVQQKLDPVERLAKLREMFFAQDESLGVNRMPLATQRQDGYPENARWTKEGVVFVTINAPGPDDNLANDAESDPRRLANAAWLTAAFDHAHSTNAPGVMVIWQTNPWEFSGGGWRYLTDILRDRTIAFGKPVVLVHGDTHVHRIDKGGSSKVPLDPSCPNAASGRAWCWSALPNFTRVETWAAGPAGSQSTETDPNKWIRVTVDPSSPQVFSFATETVN